MSEIKPKDRVSFEEVSGRGLPAQGEEGTVVMVNGLYANVHFDGGRNVSLPVSMIALVESRGAAPKPAAKKKVKKAAKAVAKKVVKKAAKKVVKKKAAKKVVKKKKKKSTRR